MPDMNNPWPSFRMVVGAFMMFMGVILINVNMAFPVIGDVASGNSVPQLIIATALLVMGFVLLVMPLSKKMSKTKPSTRKKIPQKSQHELLGIFGLE